KSGAMPGSHRDTCLPDRASRSSRSSSQRDHGNGLAVSSALRQANPKPTDREPLQPDPLGYLPGSAEWKCAGEQGRALHPSASDESRKSELDSEPVIARPQRKTKVSPPEPIPEAC